MYNFGTCFMRKINELWFEKCILYLEHLLFTTWSKWVKGLGEGFSCWSLLQYMSLILELLVNYLSVDLSYLTFLDFHKAVVFQCAYLISDFCILYNDLTFCTE